MGTQQTPEKTGKKTARVITVTSGKGGVGKTTTSTNLAIALATRGNKVCLFDADTGMANVNILLGLQPQYTLEHLLNGEKNIRDILIHGPRGLQIIPAASGIAEFAELTDAQRRLLSANLRALEQHFDYIIIDTAAGIDKTVQEFVHAAHCSMLVISQEPTSLTDAFALLRVLKNRQDPGPVYVMVNRVDSYEQSAEIYKRFASAVRKYLQITPRYIGYVKDDAAVRESIIAQQPIVVAKPHNIASRCLFTLANGIEKHFKKSPVSDSFADYWQNQQLEEHKEEAEQDSQSHIQEAPPAASFEDLASNLESQIRSQELEQYDVSQAIGQFIETYADRYKSYPFDAQKMLLASLEMDDFPKNDIREIVQTLETLYEKRYQTALRSTADEMIRFLANTTEAEEQYRELAQMLNRGYHRRYNKNLFEEVSAVHKKRPRLYPVKNKPRPYK